MLKNISGKGAVTGAEFDDWEFFTVFFPLLFDPSGDRFGERLGEFGRGRKIAPSSENGAGRGIVAVFPVEGLGHELVEAGHCLDTQEVFHHRVTCFDIELTRSEDRYGIDGQDFLRTPEGRESLVEKLVADIECLLL